ncbi:MAG TPA: hypothetical protein VN426_08495 [Syntrophomonadaceae bacterium]|nr:hypothetical protein [Syntrophomonadaceae bacterium]
MKIFTLKAVILSLLIFVGGCSHDIPAWSSHGVETFNGENLVMNYELRYQDKPICNNVKCLLTVDINGTVVSCREYNFGSIEEMDVLYLQNTIPLEKLIGFDPKSPHTHTKINISWTDNNDNTSSHTIEADNDPGPDS